MKKRSLRPIALLSLLLAFLLFTASTFSWLSNNQSAGQIYTALSDVDVEGVLSFGKNAPTYQSDSTLVTVGLTPGEQNYIGDMKYVVNYSGISPAAIRVRILEQWVDKNTGDILSQGYLNYAISATAESPTQEDKSVPAAGENGEGGLHPLAPIGRWVDHRSADFCYYYSVPVQPRLLATSDGVGVTPKPEHATTGTVSLVLIDQNGTAPALPTGAELQLLIEVEAVQPNRIHEFFGIDALPQG